MKKKFNCLVYTFVVLLLLSMNLTSCVSSEKEISVVGAETIIDETITAEVLAIDKAKRTLKLLGTSGNVVSLTVGPEARNFDQIKIGDQLTVRNYEFVAIYIGESGTRPAVNYGSALARSAKGEKPAGTVLETIDISATVMAIDREKRMVTLKHPDGKEVYRHVDKSVKAFDTLKVDDTVHAAYTSVMAIYVTKP